MEYIKNTTDFCLREASAVSLGKFDGIHKGHGRLLKYLQEKKKEGLKAVLFTFDIPPGWRLSSPGQKVLTTNEERVRLCSEHGIDCLIECPFTDAIRFMEAEDFVEMIVGRLSIKNMVVGKDFRFGHGRKGDYRLLQKLSEKYGYEVEAVDKLKYNGTDISSTFVRDEILAGRLNKANSLLGYPYFTEGTVVHGNKLGGAALGIPTANLVLPKEKLLPPFGVYLTRTVIYGQEDGCGVYGSVTNVGCKPTIEGENPVGVETHLLGFDKQIYGRKIRVEFLEMVRGEKKFGSLEELKRQMQQDIAYGIKYYTVVTNLC